MKSYPIINTESFKENVYELERFIDSLPDYQTGVDMKFLRSEEIDYIFERSWKYDYHCAISIVGKTLLSTEEELLKRITEYKFDSKYLGTGSIILVFAREDVTSIYYLDMLNIGRWVAEYNTIPGDRDNYDPYIKLIYRNYTEIIKDNGDILSLKDVVEVLKKYAGSLKDNE